MAVPYHTHNFELPAATKQEVVAGISVDKVVVPATLGSAAVENVAAFATAAQGRKADLAVSPDRKIIAGNGLQGGGNLSEDRGLALSETTLTALDNANNAASKYIIISPGSGLTGGGSLTERNIELSLNATSQAAITKAQTAVQPADLGSLAKKSKITIGDITATGTASNTSFLRGDGSWAIVTTSGTSSGDMTKSVYDPTAKNSDAFNMDNMVAGTTNKLFTTTDKTALDNAASKYLIVSPGSGLAGGGSLTERSIELSLNATSQAAITKAQTAVQPADLGTLAKKNKITIGDITATGTANSNSFLRGDGSWAVVTTSGTSSGDMTRSVYDPTAKNSDAFNMDNMVAGTTNKLFTATDKTTLDNAAAKTIIISPGSGLTGGGSLTERNIELSLNTTSQAAITKAQTAVQPADLGTLAKKNKIVISDITASGTAGTGNFLRGDGSWAAVPINSADMQKSIYDPTAKNADAFNMDNMVAGTTNKLFTATDKTALDNAAAKTIIISPGSGLTGGGSLTERNIELSLNATSQAAITKAQTAVQPADLGILAKKNKIVISDITATGTADNTSFLRGDGSWVTVTASGSGSGDMVRSVYDPNNIGKDVFNADNLIEGSRNLFLKTTERRAIAAILASQNSLVGQIAFFPATSAPSGWLKANGALVSRISYPDLWAFAAENGALVSETDWQAGASGCFSYGTGEVSMFRIPDLRGEFLRSLDDGRGIDVNRVIGSWQDSENKSHTHTISSVLSWAGTDTLQPGSWRIQSAPKQTSASGGIESRPRNIALLACIRY